MKIQTLCLSIDMSFAPKHQKVIKNGYTTITSTSGEDQITWKINIKNDKPYIQISGDIFIVEKDSQQGTLLAVGDFLDDKSSCNLIRITHET